MIRNKTPLYQEEEKEEPSLTQEQIIANQAVRKPDVNYKFTSGKHIGSILTTSSEGDLSFKKDGDIIHLDPNSSSAKFLLKQQRGEQRIAEGRQALLDAKAKKLVENVDNSGEEEEFFHEPGSTTLKGNF